jgi:hypothetical protein
LLESTVNITKRQEWRVLGRLLYFRKAVVLEKHLFTLEKLLYSRKTPLHQESSAASGKLCYSRNTKFI